MRVQLAAQPLAVAVEGGDHGRGRYRAGRPARNRRGLYHLATVTDPRVTRRTLLEGAASGSLALYLAGCGGSSSKLPPATSGGGAAVSGAVPGPPATGGIRGGRVVNALEVEGNGYDPAIAYTSTGWEAICDVLFSPLYSYDADNSPRPNAAAAMPKVSTDGLVYTIPLRKDVMFHNGRPVVAADYKYAWERVLDPKTQSWAASYIYTIKGAKELYRRQAQELTGVEVVDDHTLRVTLDPARHHVPLRPHPAVHGAGAARRRSTGSAKDFSPTRRSGTGRSRSGRTTRRASATCSRGSTTTSGRGSRISTRSSSGGASTRACSCS